MEITRWSIRGTWYGTFDSVAEWVFRENRILCLRIYRACFPFLQFWYFCYRFAASATDSRYKPRISVGSWGCDPFRSPYAPLRNPRFSVGFSFFYCYKSATGCYSSPKRGQIRNISPCDLIIFSLPRCSHSQSASLHAHAALSRYAPDPECLPVSKLSAAISVSSAHRS